MKPLVVSLLVLAAVLSPASARSEPPSILLVLTDDQRINTMMAMPTVASEIQSKGMALRNAFVSNSLCCPSRSTILTGNYAHTTGVWANEGPFGGFAAFDDSSTIATWLDPTYTTALFGKYLNGYAVPENVPYVPPGWNRWFAFGGMLTAYYDYGISDDGVLRTYDHDPADYSTSVLGDEAEALIRGSDGPLLVEYAPFAPHRPAIPAPGDGRAFDSVPKWRPPAYGEKDASDKPRYIRSVHFSDALAAEIDAVRERQLESLRAVDREVGDLLQALEDTGRLSNTLVMFTSDNGYLWGEHRWSRKLVPYEESIKVPMLVRWDGHIAAGTESRRLAVNIDLAPTFADVAGVAPTTATDGRSLVPILTGNAPRPRAFQIEHWVGESDVPSYCGIRTPRYVYVRYSGGFQELYDLRRDPHELQNAARTRPNVTAGLRARSCTEPPPDMRVAA